MTVVHPGSNRALSLWPRVFAVIALLLAGCGGPRHEPAPGAAEPSGAPPPAAEKSNPEAAAQVPPSTVDTASQSAAAAKQEAIELEAERRASEREYKRAKPPASAPGAYDRLPEWMPPGPPAIAGERPRTATYEGPAMPAFEWPPPQASEQYVLPHSIFGDDSRATRFFDVDHLLVSALEASGYTARNYYAVPNGFALATRIEQINDDGTPKTPPARFALEPEPASILRPMDYLKALLRGVPGYYRVIVFIVTSTPFRASGERPTEAEAIAWVSAGVNVLPSGIGNLPFTREVNCTVLVYEFLRKPGADADATQFATPGHLDAMTHLVKSGIWRGLRVP